MNRRDFLKSCALAAGGAVLSNSIVKAAGLAFSNNTLKMRIGPALPNIVFIMADDMGYGDLSCLNPESKIPTPNMDRVAAGGMTFTDAHSSASICTPSRYGILTGRYCWRTWHKNGGALSATSKLLIDTNRMTVASLLKKHGYETACVGKWHLGLTDSEPADFDNPLRPGPNELGFDYWFGLPMSPSKEPYVYIENGVTTAPPTGWIDSSERPALYQAGRIAPDFKHEEVMPKITQKSIEFIERHQKQQPNKPFFLYFPMTAPHLPWIPLDFNYQRSRAGVYGDFVTLVDWSVGQIMKTLERHNLVENTLLIVTSDNGSREDYIGDYNNGVSTGTPNFGHEANYIYRGQKGDAWDGGHRIPFIARWPRVVSEGSISDKTVCLMDLMATCAAIVGEKLPNNAGEDSFSYLPYLQGKTHTGPVREAVVHHSVNAMYAIRKGKWKFIDGTGSGGWSTGGDSLPGQLYDMETDPEEQNNLYNSRQDIVTELKTLLELYKSQGYSRPM
ncbi:MAG TPA: twin-arginine translocation signal domain-containing protein [Phycisphaerales bacterium]|nr:twin-arginine translocation signal domain-containing protein [Phycisphaerales bacterium]